LGHTFVGQREVFGGQTRDDAALFVFDAGRKQDEPYGYFAVRRTAASGVKTSNATDSSRNKRTEVAS